MLLLEFIVPLCSKQLSNFNGILIVNLANITIHFNDTLIGTSLSKPRHVGSTVKSVFLLA